MENKHIEAKSVHAPLWYGALKDTVHSKNSISDTIQYLKLHPSLINLMKLKSLTSNKNISIRTEAVRCIGYYLFTASKEVKIKASELIQELEENSDPIIRLVIAEISKERI